MRLYLLDKLVCVNCNHFPLQLDIVEKNNERVSTGPYPPCDQYCCYENQLINTLDSVPPCESCLRIEVSTGKLICPTCNEEFQISDGILSTTNENFGEEKKWVEEEKEWWENRYSTVKIDEDPLQNINSNNNNGDFPGNRLYERNKYLFEPLQRKGIRGKILIEIGAGLSQYVGKLIPPSEDEYYYIATDVALSALKFGSKMIPEGDFIQCSVGQMPFRKSSTDILLSLGVLHHIPFWEKNLQNILNFLNPGGWMLFNEAISKPMVLGQFRSESLTATIDSPHEGEINLDELLAILKNNGKVIDVRIQTSPVRVFLVWIFEKWMKRSLILTKSIMLIDQVFLKVAGSVFKSFGAGETLGIFEKKSEA
jgi:ubiquinone/menaquinone biosynthesis C-methylase UbiE/uncharacterized protein YbaR (Trm112 family)